MHACKLNLSSKNKKTQGFEPRNDSPVQNGGGGNNKKTKTKENKKESWMQSESFIFIHTLPIVTRSSFHFRKPKGSPVFLRSDEVG